MGWKGTMRSLSAASNKIARENERAIKKLEREKARLEKKIKGLEARKEKVSAALKNDYASGKIDELQYEKLSSRVSEVPDELLVFGKTPAVTLSKRYVCGKIDKDEFERIAKEMIPDGLEVEKEEILSTISGLQDKLAAFKEDCSTQDKACHKCSKQKGFFTPLHGIEGLKLCGVCKKEYQAFSMYNGYSGVYLTCDPVAIQEKMQIPVSIQVEWL